MWPDSEKTDILLNGARQGDASAVNRLMERHRDALRRVVQMRLDRQIQRRVDVSDVVQEVLIEANRRLADYLENPVMAFHLWLRRIAKDRIIDAHRRHRVSAKRSVDRETPLQAPATPDRSTLDLAGRLIDREITPAAAVAQREMAQLVQQAVTQLADDDMEIIAMRHYEQLTNQEAAAVLGVSQPAASMRYLRALRRLRSLLAASGDASDIAGAAADAKSAKSNEADS